MPAQLGFPTLVIGGEAEAGDFLRSYTRVNTSFIFATAACEEE